MKQFLITLMVAALAAGAAWYVASSDRPSPSATGGSRKVLFYQSAMHPWIKSDKPGRCTICGMQLTPVYEGEKGLDATGNGKVVALTQNQIQVLHVQTATAMSRPLVRSLSVSGTIDDNNMRHRLLSAYTDGRVDKLHVDCIGAEVVAGQPLIDIYSPVILQAEREYRQLQGELRKNAALRLRQLGLTPAQIEALDQKPADSLTSQILSPMSGTVVSKSVYEGQYVSTGQVMLEIGDFSTMWLMVRIYEQDLPWIRSGLTVRVTTPSVPGRTFSGKIAFINPNFEESTRSTDVRVELDNPMVDGRRLLLHRLYAEGVVELEAPTVLAVSKSSVIQTGPEAVVYIDRGSGAYEHRVVTIGRRGDTDLEVLSGLSEGDRVVTNGNLLIDGQAEMNRSFMAPAEPETAAGAMGPAPAAAPAPVSLTISLGDDQRKSIAAFLKMADAMASALGADDLSAFNAASSGSMETTGALIAALQPIASHLEDLGDARHFHGFDDLKSARAAFRRFSVAAVAVLEPLRKRDEMPAFQIYECGMVNEAVPDVPHKAKWLQTNGRQMANPFFGKAMADCGEEIQP